MPYRIEILARDLQSANELIAHCVANDVALVSFGEIEAQQVVKPPVEKPAAKPPQQKRTAKKAKGKAKRLQQNSIIRVNFWSDPFTTGTGLDKTWGVLRAAHGNRNIKLTYGEFINEIRAAQRKVKVTVAHRGFIKACRAYSLMEDLGETMAD